MAQTVGRVDTQLGTNVTECQLNYYGRRLAAAGEDGHVKLWEVSSPDSPVPIGTLSGHQGPVNSVDWAQPKYPGLIATGGYDRQVLIWKEVAEGQYQIVYSDPEGAKSSVNQVRFAPMESGLRLAACSSDGHVAVYSYDERSQTWSRSAFSSHPAGVMAVAWAPAGCMASEPAQPDLLEGVKIVSGGVDSAVRVHVFQNGTWVKEELDAARINHTDWVTSVSWRPFQGTQDIIASGSRDGTVIVWQHQSGSWRPVKVLKEEFGGQPVWTVNFSQVGGMLTVAYGKNQTAIYKETAPGTWQQVSDIDENGIAAPGSGGGAPPAPEDNAGVNLEAFGDVGEAPAFG